MYKVPPIYKDRTIVTDIHGSWTPQILSGMYHLDNTHPLKENNCLLISVGIDIEVDEFMSSAMAIVFVDPTDSVMFSLKYTRKEITDICFSLVTSAHIF